MKRTKISLSPTRSASKVRTKMKLQELITTLYPSGSNVELTPEQKGILQHKDGPAWILAGPGSGKTEVLALMVLRLLFVEGDPVQAKRVPPECLFVTTFTEKAAKNLQERILRYRTMLAKKDPSVAKVDLSKTRIGTLHGLANDVLQAARATNYRNVRLMDDLETAMFIHENMSVIRKNDFAADHSFWAHFEFLFHRRNWHVGMKRLPLQWDMTKALNTLFNRICDDRKDLNAMKKAGGPMARLATLYEEYQGHLQTDHRCDFSQLQMRLLDFLQSPEGRRLRDGVPNDPDQLGITHVLVDEYQDTNLMQESIYVELAKRAPHNITVVGDDDQAMYRFRGGSVECMVTFDEACAQFLGTKTIAKYPLVGNFRSHPQIVEFCDAYLTSFPSMKQPGARAPGKPPLKAKSNISGNYPAVGVLRRETVVAAADALADAVVELKQLGKIEDYSQACLLLGSTKESAHNAAPYADALRARGIVVYNPRSRTFLDQPEVAGLLGSLILMLDPDSSHQPSWAPNELPDLLTKLRDAGIAARDANPKLKTYLDRVRKNLEKHPKTYLHATLQELVYYLLPLPPFSDAMKDPVQRARMAQLTKLIESYASIPVQGRANVFRGNLQSDDDGSGSVKPAWLKEFYGRFFGYLAKGGVNDLEDETDIAPLGTFPIMTMHQAKGLEFPVVFVGHMGEKASVDATHLLEDLFASIPNLPDRQFPVFSAAVRAELDCVRQYYVAYSRAEHALILVGSNSHLRGTGSIPCGPTKGWLAKQALEL